LVVTLLMLLQHWGLKNGMAMLSLQTIAQML